MNRHDRRTEATEQARRPIKLWIVSALCNTPAGPMLQHGMRWGRDEREVRNAFLGQVMDGGAAAVICLVDEAAGLQRIPGFRPETPSGEHADSAPAFAAEKRPLDLPPHPDDDGDEEGAPAEAEA